MKINDVKHNHSLTDLLKILLFAILMLAPIGSVATRCLYVVCNKNAYQSYSGFNESNKNLVPIESLDTFEVGKKYNLQSHINTADNNLNEATCNIIAETCTINESVYNNVRIGFYRGTGSTSTYAYLREIDNNNNTIIQYTISATLTDNVSFVYKSMSNTFDSSVLIFFNYFEYNTGYYQDNVFEYSVSQLENDQLFSWTSNTPVYTGVNAMCTQLGISGQAIPIILSYWLILTCIYVVIDIVIKLFTLLTHMISRKAT